MPRYKITKTAKPRGGFPFLAGAAAGVGGTLAAQHIKRKKKAAPPDAPTMSPSAAPADDSPAPPPAFEGEKSAGEREMQLARRMAKEQREGHKQRPGFHKWEFRKKSDQEQFADELEFKSDVAPQFLAEAPILEDDPIELPYLPNNLMVDEDGLKIAMLKTPDPDALCGRLLKIASATAVGAVPNILGNAPKAYPPFAGADPWLKALGKQYGPDAVKAIETHVKGPAPKELSPLGNVWETIASTVTGRAPKHGGPGGAKAQALLAGAVVGGAGLWVAHAMKKRQQDQRYANVLGGLMSDPFFDNVTQKEDRVPEAYAFMRSFAPTLALNPTVARGFVRHAVMQDDTYLSQASAASLAEAEQKHLGASLSKRDLEEWMKHPLVSPFTSSGGKKKD